MPDLRWWGRFSLALAAMTFVNCIPLYLTWEAYRTDGLECLGWPLHFWTFGGFSGHEELDFGWPLLDILVAVYTSKKTADLLRDGFVALFNRLRTWVTPSIMTADAGE